MHWDYLLPRRVSRLTPPPRKKGKADPEIIMQMMGPLLKGMLPSRLRNVKSPFRSISSFGNSIVRSKEKSKDISLVEGHGGSNFDRLDESASARTAKMSADVYPLDAV